MRSILISAAAVGCLLLPLNGQVPVLRDVPADAPNVLIVRDVMPRVEALLRSPALRAALTSSEALQQELLGMLLDPASLELQLGLLSAFIPRHVEVACTEDLSSSVANLLHALTAMAIGVVASEDDGLLMATEVQVALQAFVAPIGVVRVTARDESTAEGWFEQVLYLIENLDDDSLSAEVSDARIDLTWRPLAKIAGAFDRMLGRQVDTESTAADVEIRAVLSHSEDQLILRLGEFAGTDLAAANLGELFRADDSQLLFARLESTDALEIGYRTLDLLLETELQEDSAMVMQVYKLVDMLTDLANSSNFALDVANGATWTQLHDYGVEPFELERPESEIVRCIDPTLGPFRLLTPTLDLQLSVMVEKIYKGSCGEPRDPTPSRRSPRSNASGACSTTSPARTRPCSCPGRRSSWRRRRSAACTRSTPIPTRMVMRSRCCPNCRSGRWRSSPRPPAPTPRSPSSTPWWLAPVTDAECPVTVSWSRPTSNSACRRVAWRSSGGCPPASRSTPTSSRTTPSSTRS